MEITRKTVKSEPEFAKIAFNSAQVDEFEIIQDAPDFAAEIDSLSDVLKERLGNNEPIEDILEDILRREMLLKRREITAELLLKLLLIIGDSSNVALEIETLKFASGLGITNGVSQTEVARRFGVTRQCFSTRVRNMVEKLNLVNPRGCKSEESRETYKLTNRRNIKAKPHVDVINEATK